MKEQCQHIADCEDILKCGCVTVNEVWKDIPEYEGLYQVSNLGGVKRLKFDKQNYFDSLMDNCNKFASTSQLHQKIRQHLNVELL